MIMMMMTTTTTMMVVVVVVTRTRTKTMMIMTMHYSTLMLTIDVMVHTTYSNGCKRSLVLILVFTLREIIIILSFNIQTEQTAEWLQAEYEPMSLQESN